jgi:hypothetical protein
MKLIVNAPTQTSAAVNNKADYSKLQSIIFAAIASGFEVSQDSGRIKAFKGKMVDKVYIRMNVFISTASETETTINIKVTRQVSKGTGLIPTLVDSSYTADNKVAENAFVKSFTTDTFDVNQFAELIELPAEKLKTDAPKAEAPKAKK